VTRPTTAGFAPQALGLTLLRINPRANSVTREAATRLARGLMRLLGGPEDD